MPDTPPVPAGAKLVYDAKGRPLVLKTPRLAAALSWLVPGLGHLYQGRTGKGVLFMVCILGTFVYGLTIGDGKVAYASTESAQISLRPLDWPFARDRWPFLCQAGVGGFAIPALVQSHFAAEGKALPLGELFRPPRKQGEFVTPVGDKNQRVRHPDEYAKWNYDLGYRFEIGTMYTVIAGLLNILAAYDAHGGPLVVVDRKKKKEEESSDESPDAPSIA